jgi:hypothetical protein
MMTYKAPGPAIKSNFQLNLSKKEIILPSHCRQDWLEAIIDQAHGVIDRRKKDRESQCKDEFLTRLPEQFLS